MYIIRLDFLTCQTKWCGVFIHSWILEVSWKVNHKIWKVPFNVLVYLNICFILFSESCRPPFYLNYLIQFLGFIVFFNTKICTFISKCLSMFLYTTLLYKNVMKKLQHSLVFGTSSFSSSRLRQRIWKRKNDKRGREGERERWIGEINKKINDLEGGGHR